MLPVKYADGDTACVMRDDEANACGFGLVVFVPQFYEFALCGF